VPDNGRDWHQRSALIAKLAQIKHLCKEKVVAFEIIEQLDALENMLMDEAVEGQADLSAQLSIYPLRQPSLSPTINEALAVLERFGLKVIPGSMSTLFLGKGDGLWAALREVFSAVSSHGEVVMIVTISNACPRPSCEDN